MRSKRASHDARFFIFWRFFEIGPEADLLLRKQRQNFSSFGGTRSPVRELSIEPDISSAEEPFQTHGTRVKAALALPLNVFACHAHEARFPRLRPPMLLTRVQRPTCVKEV